MDFMSDTMAGNRKFRTFNVIDDCSREVLAIEIDTSLSSKRIIRTLDRVIEQRGKPSIHPRGQWPRVHIKGFGTLGQRPLHHYPIYTTGQANAKWVYRKIQSGVQRSSFRCILVFDLYQVKQLTEEWMEEYNQRRPHEALNNLSPMEWSNLTLNEEITNSITVRVKGYLHNTTCSGIRFVSGAYFIIKTAPIGCLPLAAILYVSSNRNVQLEQS